MKKIMHRMPSTEIEDEIRSRGYRYVAGIDEAGRGALMGPVVAAAVIMPEQLKGSWVKKVNDSKLLNSGARAELFDIILQYAVSYGIGSCSNEEIDENGIARATKLAMLAAVRALYPSPDYVIIDHLTIADLMIPHQGITHGDRLSFAIACASILAKVTRDRLIEKMSEVYPQYNFAHHKGYGTAEHLECLRRYGPCPLHRRSFKPVRPELFYE